MPIITDHRPQSFDERIGNKELVSILRSMVEEKKMLRQNFKAIYSTGKVAAEKQHSHRLFARK